MFKTQPISQYRCRSCRAYNDVWRQHCPTCGRVGGLIPAHLATVQTNRVKPTSRVISPLGDEPEQDVARVSTGLPNLDAMLGGGLAIGSVVQLGGNPGAGKCLSDSSFVLDTTTGDYRPISTWRERLGPVVAIDPETLHSAPVATAAFHDQGERDVVEVTTYLGRVLRCTPSHPLLTSEGWTPVDRLAPGAFIASPRSLPYFGRDPLDEDLARLLGYVIGDGHLGKYVEVTTGVPEIKLDLERIASKTETRLAVYNKAGTHAKSYRFCPIEHSGPNAVARLFEACELRESRSVDKFVPTRVLRAPRASVAAFLSALISCDGSLYVDAAGSAGFSYSTISRRLAHQVQHLLLRFGIVTRLRTKHATVHGAPYVSYELVTKSLASLKRILESFVIHARDEAVAEIRAMDPAEKPSTRWDVVPTGPRFWERLRSVVGPQGFAGLTREAGVSIQDRRHDRPLPRATLAALARVRPEPWLIALATGDVFWDEVVRVAPVGRERVYDLTVEAHQNFVANDLFVHNSTLLAQVASNLGREVLYVTSEESKRRLARRFRRVVGARGDAVDAISTIDDKLGLDEVCRAMRTHPARIVIVDSLQGLREQGSAFSKNTSAKKHSQYVVRDIALALIEEANERKLTIILTGHATKSGDLAGLREIEHMVDIVAWLKGNPTTQHRTISCSKNRDGDTAVVAHFVMGEHGLTPTAAPARRVVAAGGVAPDDDAPPDGPEDDEPPVAPPPMPAGRGPRMRKAAAPAAPLPPQAAAEPMPERAPIRRAPTGDPEVDYDDDDEPPF